LREASLRLITGLAVAIGVTAWLWLDEGQRRFSSGLSALALAAWLIIPLALTTRIPADFLAEPGRLVAFREGAAANVAVVRTDIALDLEIDRLWQGRNIPSQGSVAKPTVREPAMPPRVLSAAILPTPAPA
jgi:hypothetical protein